MAIDLFDTRTMIEMFSQVPRPKTFLRDTFFNRNVVRFDTEAVDIDVIKGKRRVAPFVHPTVGSKTVERAGFSTNSLKPPLVAPDMITTAEGMLKRAAGENIYNAQSPDQRAAAQLGKDLVEMDDIITRREELMARDALLDGKLYVSMDDASGASYSATIDFGRNANNSITLSGTDLWDNASSDPLSKMRSWRRQIAQNTGTNANLCIMGSSAADAFLNNATLLKQLNLLKVDRGLVNPDELPEGVSFLGTVAGVDFYEYNEWYLDPADDTEKPMIPVKQILLGSRGARTDTLYGCICDPVRGSYALERVPFSWTENKPSQRFVSIQSRPMLVPTQVDAFIKVSVLA